MVWGAVIGAVAGGILQNRENRRAQRLNERQNRLALQYGFQGLDASRDRFQGTQRALQQGIGVLERSAAEARQANAGAAYQANRNVSRQVQGQLGSIASQQGVRGLSSGSASLNARARLLREAGNVYGNIGAQVGQTDANIALQGGRQVAQGYQALGSAFQQQGNTEASILGGIAQIPLNLEYQANQNIGSSVGALGANVDLLLQAYQNRANIPYQDGLPRSNN